MRNRNSAVTMFLAVLLGVLGTGCGEGHEHGAETPQALLTRYVEAIDTNDEAALAALMPHEDQSLRDLNAAAFYNMYRVSLIVDQAKQKFGEQELSSAAGEAFGPIGLIAWAGDTRDMAAEGHVQIDGDHADVKHQVDYGDMGQSIRTGLVMIRRDGRWYLRIDIDSDSAEERKRAEQGAALMRQLADELKTILDQSDDVNEFVESSGAVYQRLSENFDPIQRGSQN